VCSEEDFVEKENDEGDTFTHLSPEHYAETVETLQDEYGYIVTPGDQDSDGSGDDDEYTDTSQDGATVITAEESDAPEDSDVADMDAVLGEDVNKDTLNNGDSSSSNSDEKPDGNSGKNNTTNDNTPNGDTLTIPGDIKDVDKYVVSEFTDRFCNVTNEDDNLTRKNDLADAFFEWVEKQDVDEELDEISSEVYITNRKGNLTSLLEEEFDRETKRRSVDGRDERPRCFVGVELTSEM
jgi:hypothetical protein